MEIQSAGKGVMLQGLLEDPGFQAGGAPFAAALLVALMLRRWGAVGSSLALLGGWALAVELAVGWRLLPLSASRKLLLLALAAVAIGWLLERRPALLRPLPVVALALLLGAGSALWLLWPLLARGVLELGAAAAAAAWIAWLVGALLVLGAREPVVGLTALAGVAGGVGGAALLGASALLGQLALAAAAAAGGTWLATVAGRATAPGPLGLLPLALAVALAAVAGAAYARLPWEALLPLVALPAMARLGPRGRLRRLWALGWAAAAAGAALWWAWQVRGAPLW